MLEKTQQIYDTSIFLCKLTRRKQEVKNFQYVKKDKNYERKKTQFVVKNTVVCD